MSNRKDGGWVDGESAITYQRCSACDHVWYFRRSFCPGCGAPDEPMLHAAGIGQVYALSLVHRAPSEALRTFAPYLVVLVDMEEGFRLMAHGDPSLAIGERVRARYAEFGGKVIPYFEKDIT
jgi:uncharacterized OB-fold protein